jgi:hypothetical protein
VVVDEEALRLGACYTRRVSTLVEEPKKAIRIGEPPKDHLRNDVMTFWFLSQA